MNKEEMIEFLNDRINKIEFVDEKLTPVAWKNVKSFEKIRDFILSGSGQQEKFSQLNEMMLMQSELNNAITDWSAQDWQTMFDKTCIAIQHEVCEAQQETNWKYWTFNHNKPDLPKLKEELADILHFFFNLCLLAGMSGDDIEYEYKRKNAINHQRVLNGYVKDSSKK
jgi:dimeric dUTPase (all-alpha-NTP-PPase superfamily)